MKIGIKDIYESMTKPEREVAEFLMKELRTLHEERSKLLGEFKK